MISPASKYKTEDELREAVERYELAVQGSTHGLWDWKIKKTWDDSKGEFWGSEQFFGLLGFSENEQFYTIGDWFDRVHADDIKSFKASLEKHFASKDSFDRQCRFRMKNGEYHWFRIRGRAVWTGETVVRMAGSLVDIDSRIHAERELMLAEEKYRSVFENSAVAITVTDEHERIVSWNAFTEQLLGMGSDDLFMKPVKSLYPEAEWARMQSMNLRKKGMMHHFETKVIRKGNALLDIDISVTVLKTPDGGKTGSIGIIRDISERKKAEIVMQKLSSVVEKIGDIVIITDKNGTIEYVNPAFESNTGYSKDEVIGNNPRILKSGKMGSEYYKKFWDTILAGEVFSGTVINKKKNGEFYYEEQVITPLKDSEGKVTHFVSTARDISARIQTENALQQAKEEAVAASRAKSEFLANMSHEIRTPLNGVLGMAGLLLESGLSGEQKEYAESVRASADSLLSVINDILDFSKIEAGKLIIEPIPFDLRLSIEEVADMLVVKAQEKNIELIVRYDPEAPRRVIGDPVRVRQLITNFVSNAIKFTEKGQVLIDVSLKETIGKDVELHFSVEDSGIGIAQEHLPHIFDKFTQADASTTRKYGGTGLGLAICKQLVELMEGKIGAESEWGKGSVFWFELKFPIDNEKPLEIPSVSLSDIHMVIVEDNKINQRVIQEQMNGWKIKHEIYSAGPEGIAAMKAAKKAGKPFDIAILDFQLPDMDGEMIAKAIKEDPEISDMLLILLTSRPMRGDAKHFESLGFSAYLSKPVRQSYLMDAIATVWGAKLSGEKMKLLTKHALREARGDIKEKQREISSPVAAKTIMPSFNASVLLAEDNAVNQQVARKMLEKLGCQVEVANNGREAYEKVQLKSYDVIFMDCQMPEMDGYAATQAIRKLAGAVAQTPIVAITANAMQGDREKCLSAGMDDYVSKPVKTETLQQMLSRWAKQSQKAPLEKPAATIEKQPVAANSDQAKPKAQGVSNGSAINMERLQYLKEFADDGDCKFIHSLFETYFGSADKRLEAIKAAAQEQNAVQMGREAHGLKGSSSNLGADHVATLCRRLEEMGKAGDIGQVDQFIDELEDALKRVRAEYDANIAGKVF